MPLTFAQEVTLLAIRFFFLLLAFLVGIEVFCGFPLLHDAREWCARWRGLMVWVDEVGSRKR